MRIRHYLAAAFFLISCKETAESVAERGIQVTKETAKGIEEGIDKGRKAGESADGAVIASSPADLAGRGIVLVHSVSDLPSQMLPPSSSVVLSVENLGDRPLRLTKLSFLALDKDKFSKVAKGAPSELTVPPKAKEKVSFTVDESAARLAKIRYWDAELEVPPQVVVKGVASTAAKATNDTAPKSTTKAALDTRKKGTLQMGF